MLLIVCLIFLPFKLEELSNPDYMSILPWLTLILSMTLCGILFMILSAAKFERINTVEVEKRKDEREDRLAKYKDDNVRMKQVLDFRQEMERIEKEKAYTIDLIKSMEIEKGSFQSVESKFAFLSSFVHNLKSSTKNINKPEQEL